MKYICVLITVLLASATTLAASIPFVKNFTNKEVMCPNWDIEQDSKGIIYIANRYGLVCYDGKTWQTYTTNENRTIRSLHIAPDDRIYIGSYEEFGYFERNEYGKLVYSSISSLFRHKELKNKDIWSIEQEEHLIYFQSFAGYFSFDTQSNKVAFYPVKGMMQRLYKVDNKIYAIVQDELYRLEKNSLTKLPATNSPLQSPVRSMLPYNGNRLLIQTENQGFWIYDQGQYTPQTTINRTPDISGNNEALYAGNGNLLAGTRSSGLLCFDPQGSLLYKLDHQTKLQHNTVLSLFKDKSNNIWIGLEKGLSLAFINDSFSFHYLKENNIGSIFDVALWNDYLYIASNQGLWRIKAGIFMSQEQSFSPERVNLPGGFVQKLLKTDEGLIIGHSKATYLLNRQNQLSEMYPTGGALAGTEIHYPQQRKGFLLGSYNSINLYDIEPDGNYSFRQRLTNFNGYPRYMEFDNNGNLWVAHTRKGIYKLKLDKNRSSFIGNEFISCIGDSSRTQMGVFNVGGRIVFTDEKQFYTYNDLSDSIVPYDRLNTHLEFITHTKHIVKVDNTYYWFITDRGVALVNMAASDTPVIEKVLLFDNYNLRMHKDFESIVPVTPEYSILCAENALVAIPNKPETNPSSPSQELIFNHIISYNILKDEQQSLPVRTGDTACRLTSDFNSLEVQVAYPAYNEDIYFQFKLEENGIEKHWQEKQNTPSINIQRLPAGNYCLKCRAIDEKGIAVATASFSFSILPPWYLSPWAYAGYIFLLAMILLAIYAGVRRRTLRQQRHIIREREQQIIELENKRLNDEILFKGKELTQSTMTIIENNKILLAIKEEIENHKRMLGSQYPNKYYQKLIDMIDNATSKGKEWDLFLSNFDLIHEHFFRNLRQRFPELTPNDLKLCALLRLNMSTKDMADMLNIGVRAVETARYRLRKKMELDSSVDLVQFLIDF
ncbi:hypothetical protein [Bacteroides faecium]|uniref:HTH luxR-type domain-containing protein n=1 Tax=Bacteroides faecium TaxID=2715212 RepID=A0A6H0KJX3_9BACE|nr:hypothetical protein [Bacteroides faecium]QIU93595.1 hypothetical protein BacF7301_05275 [Bacteroides faecium]